MLSSDWLIKGVYFLPTILSFFLLFPVAGVLSLEIPDSVVFGKYPFPSLKSL